MYMAYMLWGLLLKILHPVESNPAMLAQGKYNLGLHENGCTYNALHTSFSEQSSYLMEIIANNL